MMTVNVKVSNPDRISFTVFTFWDAKFWAVSFSFEIFTFEFFSFSKINDLFIYNWVLKKTKQFVSALSYNAKLTHFTACTSCAVSEFVWDTHTHCSSSILFFFFFFYVEIETTMTFGGVLHFTFSSIQLNRFVGLSHFHFSCIGFTFHFIYLFIYF